MPFSFCFVLFCFVLCFGCCFFFLALFCCCCCFFVGVVAVVFVLFFVFLFWCCFLIFFYIWFCFTFLEVFTVIYIYISEKYGPYQIKHFVPNHVKNLVVFDTYRIKKTLVLYYMSLN